MAPAGKERGAELMPAFRSGPARGGAIIVGDLLLPSRSVIFLQPCAADL